MITIWVSPANADYFFAMIDDEVVCKSRTPFLSAARYLLEKGVNPRTRIVMKHEGTPNEESLKSTVGAAAKLMVEEGNNAPHFRPWKAYPTKGEL